MIPISDVGVRRRRFPFVNLLLIAVNAVVFIYELALNDVQLQHLVFSFGAVPREIISGVDIPPSGPNPIWLTLFTSMFIHGGWLHFGGNMLYLWVFGDNVEDTLGSLRYLLFYLLTGIIASFTQIATAPDSRIPSIGASGAIAGVLGAYLLLFPQARVRALISFGFFIRIVPVPAILLIGFWALVQFFSGIAALGVATMQTGGVAYWAHIGGFLGGLLLTLLFRKG